jgi:hypothetical protein
MKIGDNPTSINPATQLHIEKSGLHTVVLDNGNVGIGTTSPATRLHITNGSAYGALMLGDNSGTNNHHLTHETDGSFGLWTGVFGTGTRQLTVTSTGNVGIGTVSPGGKLDVNGKLLTYGGMAVSMGYVSNRYPGIGFNDVADTYQAATAGYGGLLQFDNTMGDLTYYTGSNVAALASHTHTALLTIKPTGNVGIGTTSPAQKLSVVGTIESTSGGFKFPDGTTQTTAATTSTIPAGTLCGFAGYNSSWGWSATATCQGHSPQTSCPSGYTSQSFNVWGVTQVLYYCVKN